MSFTPVSTHWQLSQGQDVQLVSARRVSRLADLTTSEYEELWVLLQAGEQQLRRGGQATIIRMAPSDDDHLVVRIVPTSGHRFDSGGGLAEALRASLARRPAARPRREPSSLVRGVVRILDAAQRCTLYDPLLRRWRGPLPRDPAPPVFPRPVEWLLGRLGAQAGRRSSADFATVYVGLWLVVLAVSLALACFAGPAGAAIGAALAAYRSVDIATFQARSLVDRRAQVRASFERTLVFVGINILELAIAATALYVSALGLAPVDGARVAFGVVTLTGGAPGGGAPELALQVVFTLISLTVLAGALAVVVGLVGQGIDEGSHESKPAGIASDDA